MAQRTISNIWNGWMGDWFFVALTMFDLKWRYCAIWGYVYLCWWWSFSLCKDITDLRAQVGKATSCTSSCERWASRGCIQYIVTIDILSWIVLGSKASISECCITSLDGGVFEALGAWSDCWTPASRGSLGILFAEGERVAGNQGTTGHWKVYKNIMKSTRLMPIGCRKQRECTVMRFVDK